MLLFLLAAFAAAAQCARPEQVHIAYHGDPTTMAVSWITFEKDESLLLVNYGPTTDPQSQQVMGTIDLWTGNINRYVYRALLTDLKPSTQYSYTIGDRSFNFKTLATNPQSYKACVFGDLGYYHGNSTESLIRRGLAGGFDIIFHIGDISYDMHDDDGKTGDNFMNQLEPLVSTIPYMIIAGNHENDKLNFSQVQRRFWMPETNYHDNQFHSLDLGPVHWVGLSSEYYAYMTEYGVKPIENQYRWLTNDLQSARKRYNELPWLITYQHRPFYCSNEDALDCNDADNLFIRNGGAGVPGLEKAYLDNAVDLVFAGHEHSYERTYPIADKKYFDGPDAYTNAKAPVYVVTGSAGCHSPGNKFTKIPSKYSVVRSDDYGYTILTVANQTHLHIEQISLDKNEENIDDLWIVKGKSFMHSEELRQKYPGTPLPKRRCHPMDLNCLKTVTENGQKPLSHEEASAQVLENLNELYSNDLAVGA